jgi:TetR/AcrR family transcriptional regulator, regulator of cefoperazone and chloramphenicol sensitivity
MKPPTPKRTRTTSPARPKEDEQTTRRRLLEAAGQVFADRGFDGATGKEICERAGTNTAAINYYFGGMEGLYAAVAHEIPKCMVTVEALSAAVAGKRDARAKLEAVIGLLVRTLTGPAPSSWVFRFAAREWAAPSPVLDSLREKEMLPKTRILRNIVAELMELPEDHPAVARGCVSVLAPCFMLLISDRRMLKRAFPPFSFAAEDAPALVHHMVQFALAGLSAVAAEVRKDNPK